MKAAEARCTSGISSGGPAGKILELQELRCFHSLARTGNFGRASRELNLPQPSVTYRIQKLERELGTQLLVPHSRGVTLTQAGSCLMDRLDVIMPLLNSPLEPAQVPRQSIGTVSLGLPAELAPQVAPPLIEQCRTRWPGLTLAVHEGHSAALEEWVIGRRVDVSLVQDPPTLQELHIELIVNERLGLVSGVRLPSRLGAGPIGIRQLAGLDLILPHPRHWIRRRIEAAAFRRGVVLDRVQQVNSVPLSKEMVRNGLGCAVLPYVAVQDEIARGCLMFHPFGHETLCTVHAIACRRTAMSDPFVVAFCDFLRDAVIDLVKVGTWAGATVMQPQVAPSAYSLELGVE
jgi:LysR family nitrogen assimilation transcriptional regulator